MYNYKLTRDLAIVVIGGGTGLPVLLRGIKRLTSNIAAIVTVADDGGSSGRLRADFGIIPTGDLRNCLVALAETEPIMEKLFQHRFEGNSDLSGHSVGNLLLAALINITGDAELALKQTSKVLAVRGNVLPSATDKITLVAKMTDGDFIEGESKISAANKKIERVFLKPGDAIASKSAVETIQEANICILGPGSLYTSVMPNLLLKGIAAALRSTAAAKIYICNVMTQPGETEGYTAYDHVKAIVEHVGRGLIDYVLVNSKEIAPELKTAYALEGACPVAVDVDAIEKLDVKVIKADLISETNLVRHDPEKLSESIVSLIRNLNLGFV